MLGTVPITDDGSRTGQTMSFTHAAHFPKGQRHKRTQTNLITSTNGKCYEVSLERVMGSKVTLDKEMGVLGPGVISELRPE